MPTAPDRRTHLEDCVAKLQHFADAELFEFDVNGRRPNIALDVKSSARRDLELHVAEARPVILVLLYFTGP
jgi:hypothetical protein